MTNLQNTTISEIISKTSFKQYSLGSDLLITGMNCGFTFIQAYKMAKQLSK